MKSVLIIPFQEKTQQLYAAIKEFSLEKIILLSAPDVVSDAQEVQKDLEKLQIPVEFVELSNPGSMEEMLTTMGQLAAKEKGHNVLVHLGASKEPLHCTALSSSFVHGLPAFTMKDNKPNFYPILKFSYYDLLSEKKLKLLELLTETNCCDSLEALSKKAQMGPSLVNYHIYGDQKNPGLKDLGLIELDRDKGKIQIKLTSLGKLLLNDKLIPAIKK
jgi:DNA-binding transcriptional ArsR family regulator